MAINITKFIHLICHHVCHCICHQMQFIPTFVTLFATKFITKFGDSLNSSPNFVTNSSQKTLVLILTKIILRGASSVCQLHTRVSRFLPSEGWVASRRCSSCNIQVTATTVAIINTKSSLSPTPQSPGPPSLLRFQNGLRSPSQAPLSPPYFAKRAWEPDKDQKSKTLETKKVKRRSGLAGRVPATARSAVSPSTPASRSVILHSPYINEMTICEV